MAACLVQPQAEEDAGCVSSEFKVQSLCSSWLVDFNVFACARCVSVHTLFFAFRLNMLDGWF